MKKILRLPALKFRNEYFLLGLPLFFVLHGYTDHYGEIPGKDALFLTMEYLSYVLVFTLLFALALRSFRKGAVYSFLICSFYFFFGAAHDAMKEALGDSFLVSYSFILPVAFLAFTALFLCLRKTGRGFSRLSRYLNTALLLLILWDGISLVIKSTKAQAKPTKVGHVVPAPAHVLPLADTSVYPDIHLVVADEYAGRTALQEVFGFDNTPFEHSLRRRGFYVVDSSRSNYNYTVASMASLFEMEYLPELIGKKEQEIYRISKAIVNENKFISFIQTKGYSIRNFSIFDFARIPPFGETYFPQKIELITSNTFLARLKADIGYHAALTLRIASELDKVEKALRWEAEAESRKMDSVVKEVAIKHKGPRFFYTHLMMPHAPYLLDKEENLIRLEQNLYPGKKREEKELYLGYLQYANKKLLEFIDKIQMASVTPPVILLMSDHGLRRDWVPVPYHFNTINAVFQGGNEVAIYRGISNVNQLRTLVNSLFGQQLPILLDSSILLDGKNIDPAL